ncbi:MAG: YcnI family protein [Solirubrobacteraceae bacterium]|nr:YcnI family protein [Solirubrobacteraceae bacterium]
MKLRFLAGAAAAALALPAAAQAHVTLQPSTPQTPGAYTVLTMRVPNERDNASTTKIRLEVPEGIYAVSYKPVPGWRITVRRTPMATPVQTEDGPITHRVSSILFRGSGKGLGRIRPGQFQEFALSLRLPETPGATLVFPAIQTYSNGEVVRWTGPAGSALPAATVKLSDAVAPAHH